MYLIDRDQLIKDLNDSNIPCNCETNTVILRQREAFNADKAIEQMQSIIMDTMNGSAGDYVMGNNMAVDWCVKALRKQIERAE